MKAANILADELKARFERVDCHRIEASDESSSFLGQCRRAFFKKKAKIKEIPANMADYDLIAIGTPVWAFEPTPAVRAYLDQITGASGKKAVLFATYGSGTGKERCLNRIEAALKEKGLSSTARFSIQQFKLSDEPFVRAEIKKCLASIL